MLVYFILKRILIIRKKDTGYSDRCKKKKKKTQREQVRTAKNLLNMFFFLKFNQGQKQILLPVNESLVQYLKPGKNQSAKVLT